jgi:glycerol-1-phosphate dehydrogenase [NAD(P)+]
MKTDLPVYIGRDAIPHLIHFCQNRDINRFTLVADQNTFPALGKTVNDALTGEGYDVSLVLLSGEEIIADEHYIMQVLVQVGRQDRMYLAVGSGTITDIVRFVSHRTKTDFISLPTAPSVDGFTSAGAPLVIERLKQTVYCHPPLAVFADLDTLCAAPSPMIAAGFGDLLGKYTSLADWKLGYLLWDEPYDESIAQRTWNALQDCVGRAQAIGEGSPEGVRSLMNGLIESGLCMLDFGGSHPASGAEHYLSHLWEMKLLWEDRPAILHGAKVGVACSLVAGFYEQIKSLSPDQAAERLSQSRIPDRQQEVQRIHQVFGPIAEKVIGEQAPFLEMSQEAFELLKRKIVNHWDDIQKIAYTVPTSQELVGLLDQVDGPATTKALGLSDEEASQGLKHAHYFRNRFTVMKLARILGIPLTEAQG